MAKMAKYHINKWFYLLVYTAPERALGRTPPSGLVFARGYVNRIFSISVC